VTGVRLRRGRVLTVAGTLIGLVVVLAGIGLARSGSAKESYTEQTLQVTGTPEPDGARVSLDSTIFLPERTPAPAVLLAHGYGGTKASVAADARDLAEHGYVVLTYSARGFGSSQGLIHLDSPDYEVKDGQRMLDLLARRQEVRQDGPSDPHVAVVGASYGGALALMLTAVDHRVDAEVPIITWNDLRQSLFPQFVTGTAQTSAAGITPVAGAGVFKRQWTALLLGSSVSTSGVNPLAVKSVCGRIATDLCVGYLAVATTGRPGTDLLNLLSASSPARVAGRITAPTLLIQGQSDSLFPLSEADANARAIAANGTDVRLLWETGGHDGGTDESALRAATAAFLAQKLGVPSGQPASTATIPGFQVSVPDAVVSSTDTNPAPQLRANSVIPGISGEQALQTRQLALTGGTQFEVSPPGATPAAITTLPGVSGALSSLLSGAGPAAGSGLSNLGVLPGQSVTFETQPLPERLSIVGSSRVTIEVTSTAPDATLFASLLDVAPDGTTTLPRQLVNPLRITGLGTSSARQVTIALPAIVRDIPVGHRLRVVLASTDQAYALPQEARAYRIGLAGNSALSVPQVPLAGVNTDTGRPLWIATGVLAAGTLLVVLAFGFYHRRIRRRTVQDVDPQLRGVPLAIQGLGKAYGDGFRAVSDLSFRVEAGQVLGLLGPNGAGKTTTLRMLMGLILPSEGEIRIFGHQVTPGAAVLSRLGSFIEGPGFLPHLSGRDNLDFYWRSTGRRGADSGMQIALEIAGLGPDVERKVRTYSQGMRQRLAIAQAMLGLPDLLVLDEPTNGLDPPQIREMREVLGRYAATGRTVVVSSHLLAEVEQTCSHVVVMANGRLIAQGPVGELVGAGTSLVLDLDDPERAAVIAAGVEGVHDVAVTETGLKVTADVDARALLVRALVLADLKVERIAPQRGLEETFLALVGEAS
jgi:ABC-2 type transport system ATP-binding protein